uniref:Outer membrane protein beta-barrel domain-containing protein n=1 Tax=candidate division WOR-3 bacterium TaxID=2052148 RepID=A0A7C1NHE2_UNCW3
MALFLLLFTGVLPGRLHFGLELSELLQNRFHNPGPDNFTLLTGMETEKPGVNFGCRLLVINVRLSNWHLQTSRFISGDKSGLEGRLFISRLYADICPVKKELGILRLLPVAGLGMGYDRTVLTNSYGTYDLRGWTLNAAARLQTELIRRVFVEFPVVNIALYLNKNRPARERLGTAIINYPEWGAIYLWLNLGVKFTI